MENLKKENTKVKKLKKQALFFGVFLCLLWILELMVSYFSLFEDIYVTIRVSPIGILISIGTRIIGIAWILFNGLQLRLNVLVHIAFAIFSPVITAFLVAFSNNTEDFDETNDSNELA